ncbi:heme-binding domain-containing protein [Echinicola sp. CAU 1574]|uniref:Heme-binding domain-containing protein n=1 Tax=Echinicola arenosa TaxID=2774144 RepID=A0ABR9ALN8_9BACT|nr:MULTISPECIES: heme-binding domain-containing protein [Echinicola]MBD8489716.1 heme-binding domain-containing protein [Echinicola arenosa]
MKKLFLIPMAAIIGLLFFQGTQKSETPDSPELHAVMKKMPKKVKAIVDEKCYGCHNANAKSEKAKSKLDWDALEATKKSEQIDAKAKIYEVLAKGDMPPKRFLENKPEGKLSEEEIAALMKWSAVKKK